MIDICEPDVVLLTLKLHIGSLTFCATLAVTGAWCGALLFRSPAFEHVLLACIKLASDGAHTAKQATPTRKTQHLRPKERRSIPSSRRRSIPQARVAD